MSDERTERYRAVLLIGAPGSGKGTQGRAIAQLPGFHLFSTGEVLRNLNASTDLGSKVGCYLRNGDLVPNNLVLEVWLSHMDAAVQRREFTASRDILLMDAYPRDIDQARSLESHIDFRLIVHLHADDERLLKQRLRDRNSRPDDRDESVIAHRFDVYHLRTTPLLDYFPSERIKNINADEPPIEVLRNVATACSVLSC